MSLAPQAKTLALPAHAGLVAQTCAHSHAAFSGRAGQVLDAKSAQAAQLRPFQIAFRSAAGLDKVRRVVVINRRLRGDGLGLEHA